MSPHDDPTPPPEEPPAADSNAPSLADFAGELASALQGIEDAYEKLSGSDHIAASLLVHLAARLWTEAGAQPETFVSLAETLVKLEAQARGRS